MKKLIFHFLGLMTFSYGNLAQGAVVNSNDIVIDLNLNISVEEAWNLWTDERKIEQWLTTKAHVVPKLSGAYELFWDPENPNENSTIGCHITALIPNKLLSFEWKGPVPYADLMNVDPTPTWVQVSFEPLDPSKTIIHFRHSGWRQSARWADARTWQLNAWSRAFQNLK